MTTTDIRSPERAAAPHGNRNVVYLLGAGATHGCAKHAGNESSLLMKGLMKDLRDALRELAAANYPDDLSIARLVNEVVTEEADVEQLITFLDDSTAEVHRAFADDLRRIFASVLRRRLGEVESSYSPNHSWLYAALIDMHEIASYGETLAGFLTLNYDVFLEHAIREHLGQDVDYGIGISNGSMAVDRRIKVLKLHGSFGWRDGWPVEADESADATLWIPPGIRKSKGIYPFNAIWGMAKELLDCDVLRIVGCRLGANDWDLISLLFTSRHFNAGDHTFDVELITDMDTARQISGTFRHLDPKSLFDMEDMLPNIATEVLMTPVELVEILEGDDRLAAEKRFDSVIRNPFEYWLLQRAESMSIESPSDLDTSAMVFRRFADGVIGEIA